MHLIKKYVKLQCTYNIPISISVYVCTINELEYSALNNACNAERPWRVGKTNDPNVDWHTA